MELVEKKVINIKDIANNKKKDVTVHNDTNEDFTKLEFLVPKGWDVQIKLKSQETKDSYNIKRDNLYYDYETILDTMSNKDTLPNANKFIITQQKNKSNATITETCDQTTLVDFYHKILNDTYYISRLLEIEDDIRQGKKMVDKMNNIFKEQLSFLLYGNALLIMSLVGISLFYATGFYIIHPTIYLITAIMGLGWSLTAIMSIRGNDEGDKSHD